MNPRDKRAKASELKAEAQTIYEKHKGDDSPDMSDDEARRYDACLDEAEKLCASADAEDARENRMNALDAKLRTEGRGDGGRSNGNMPHNDDENTRNGRLRYSLLKALRQMDPRNKNQALDGVELETHQEMLKVRHAAGNKKDPQGVLIPWDLPIDVSRSSAFRNGRGIERRDLTVTTGAGAVYEVVSPTMIELLRNTMLSRQLGARVMANMEGNFSIPKQTGGGTAYWVTEGNAVTESNQTVGSVDFSPSTVGCFGDYSRAFLHQTGVDAEAFIREDFTQVIAIELDRVAFNGSGSGAEPEGVIPNANVNVVAIGTNGGPGTWAKLVEMEQVVATQNALVNNMALVTNPKVRGSFKGITRVASSTFGDFLWADNQEVISYPAYASNQIPSTLTKGTSAGVCSAAILGDWSQIIFALWGGMDTLVDPFTGGTAGNIRIVILQDADLQVRQPKAFAVIKDLTTP
jgi:HK97 family phage major capsid protein